MNLQSLQDAICTRAKHARSDRGSRYPPANEMPRKVTNEIACTSECGVIKGKFPCTGSIYTSMKTKTCPSDDCLPARDVPEALPWNCWHSFPCLSHSSAVGTQKKGQPGGGEEWRGNSRVANALIQEALHLWNQKGWSADYTLALWFSEFARQTRVAWMRNWTHSRPQTRGHNERKRIERIGGQLAVVPQAALTKMLQAGQMQHSRYK